MITGKCKNRGIHGWIGEKERVVWWEVRRWLERNGDQRVRELFHYMRAKWVNKDNTGKKQRDIPQEADG